MKSQKSNYQKIPDSATLNKSKGFKTDLLKQITVAECYNSFKLHIKCFSQETQNQYTRTLDKFIKYVPEHFENISVEHIERFIFSGELKASSRNTYLFAIKSFFRWANENHGVENIALKIKKLKNPPPKQRILSREEYEKVIESTSGFTRDVITFLSNTGLRISELLFLTKENINEQFIVIVGKGGCRVRRIPLNSTVKYILADSAFLSSLRFKSRYHLNYLCIKAAKKAGIPKFSPHSLRHFFASELHYKGISIYVISKLLGHRSVLTTTAIYVHWEANDLIGVTECLI